MMRTRERAHPSRPATHPPPTRRFRAETSWPVKSLVHEQFSDGFPALAMKLASPGGQPDAEGFFHYWFGVCDFDTQQQCEQAAATLRSLCAEMAKAPEAMARLRPTLEDHMRYWQRSPAATALAQLGNPPPPSQPNQYYARSPDSIKKGRWTDDEHQQFMDLMAVHGKSWSKIAAHMVNRSEPQVRSHAQKHFAKERKEQEEAAAALAGQPGEPAADDGSAPPKKARLKNAAGAVAPTDGGGAILGLAQLGSAQAFQAPAPQAPAPPAFAASSEADADRAVASLLAAREEAPPKPAVFSYQDPAPQQPLQPASFSYQDPAPRAEPPADGGYGV